MRKFIQQSITANPTSNFTLPSGWLPGAGTGLVVTVNGQVSPHFMTSATGLTLRTATPARAIVDFFEDDQAGMPINVADQALDFPSIAANSNTTLNVTVQGALPGQIVDIGLPVNIPAGIIYQAYVLSANVVTVQAFNVTATAVDPVNGVFKVAVR